MLLAYATRLFLLKTVRLGVDYEILSIMCSVTCKRTKTISDNNQEQSVPIDESVDTSNIDKN